MNTRDTAQLATFYVQKKDIGHYRATKTAIEAISGVSSGMIAFATDTKKFGVYNGTTWSWFSPDASPLTPGSVIFAGASGELTEDNGNLFYDNANNRLGVGTSSPSERLHVAGNAYTTGTVGVGTTPSSSYILDAKGNPIRSRAEGAVYPGLRVEQYSNDTYQPLISLTKGGGTIASPAGVVDGRPLGSIQFRGIGTDGVSNVGAEIVASATETWGGAAAHGSKISINTTANLAAIQTLHSTFENNGQLALSRGGVSVPCSDKDTNSGLLIGGIRFANDFSYGWNGTVTPIGGNTFTGMYAGNPVMGSEATSGGQSSYNSGFGFEALRAITNGSYNSVFGHGAMATCGSKTNHLHNTVLGYFGLNGFGAGSYNTVIGSQAGQALAGLENSIILGARATAKNSYGDTNEIVIGYFTQGLGSNSVVLGNSSIALTALRGQVGVNTTAPATGANLDVDGTTRSLGLFTPRASALTIASDAITVTGSYHTIDTESSAASDSLATISGCAYDGYRLTLRIASGQRVVIMKHATGNIYISSGRDLLMGSSAQTVNLIYDANLGYWIAEDDNYPAGREDIAGLSHLGFSVASTAYSPAAPYSRVLPGDSNYQFNTAVNPGWLRMRSYGSAGPIKLVWTNAASTSYHWASSVMGMSIGPMTSASQYLYFEIRGYAIETPVAGTPYVALQFRWEPTTYPQMPLNMRLVKGTGIVYSLTDATSGASDAGAARVPLSPGSVRTVSLYGNTSNYIGFTIAGDETPFGASYYSADYAGYPAYFRRVEWVMGTPANYNDVIFRDIWMG